MRYLSTRDTGKRVTAAQAIAKGLSEDGGLFVPEVLTSLSENAIETMCAMSYQQRAVYIMGSFLDDFTAAEVTSFAENAYNTRNFHNPYIAPVHTLFEDTHFLELWHGPTCAFKDMALQILPYLLTASLEKTGEKKEVCVLVATSGDTGKAALEGFCDVDRTKILVFYPENGVSDVQRLQMTTQLGHNVGICAVRGNFDDAQTGVKGIFSDSEMKRELEGMGYMLSSANSINWGRLLPQIVYYISAYCDLVNSKKITLGDKINVCVPTGNFGNILAAYYAKKMGLPIKRLICASNENNVLTDFIKTGVYDRNRDFYTTISPSMDILVSSNLERLLFDVSGNNADLIKTYMKSLRDKGNYTVSPDMYNQIDKLFWSGYCSDEKTGQVINATYKKYGYLIDTHTAVAFDVLNHYRHDTGDRTPALIVSTANPYKFCGSVLSALGEECKASGLELIKELSDVTGVAPPKSLLELSGRSERFKDVVDKGQMTQVVREFIGQD